MVSGGYLQNIVFGEAVTAPCWIYIKPDDGKGYKGTISNPAMCVALEDYDADEEGQVWFSGVADWPWEAEAGTTYYMSSTPGVMTNGRSDIYQVLGIGVGQYTLIILAGSMITGALAYPVGSIFTSTVDTNPNALLGYGEWVAFAAGRTLVGLNAADSDFDTVEHQGGAKTHTLTEAEMPEHTHIQDAHSHVQSVNGSGSGASSGYSPFSSSTPFSASGFSTQDTTATNQVTGGGGAHNNLQPYIVVYFWKRTA